MASSLFYETGSMNDVWSWIKECMHTKEIFRVICPEEEDRVARKM